MNATLTYRVARIWWCLLGVLFIWAGASKLSRPADFLASIYAYKLPLPDGLSRFVALTLPWFEILSGVLLISGWFKEALRPLCMGILAAFALVTGQAWLRGLELSCGCFELKFLPMSIQDVLESAGFAFARNLVLLSICLGFLRLECGVEHGDRAIEGRMEDQT